MTAPKRPDLTGTARCGTCGVGATYSLGVGSPLRILHTPGCMDSLTTDGQAALARLVQSGVRVELACGLVAEATGSDYEAVALVLAELAYPLPGVIVEWQRRRFMVVSYTRCRWSLCPHAPWACQALELDCDGEARYGSNWQCIPFYQATVGS